VEAEVGLYGYDSWNVFLTSQENACMTTRLFELWAREVFFPAVAQRRSQFGDTGMAKLLLDGLGSHHTDEFLETCAGQGIDVLFVVLHSSHQSQPLDVLTFALMKRFSRLENPQSNRLVRILRAWNEPSALGRNRTTVVRIWLLVVEEPLRSRDYYLKLHLK
jgi:hypothetical protein